MFISYLIKKGDTLDNISRNYGISKEYLMDINNISYYDDIKEGRELIVPSINEGDYVALDGITYKIEKGDTLYAISKKYNVNPSLLSALNGLNMEEYIYPGQEIMIPKKGYSYYITAEGDTLKTVSDTFGANYQDLINQNKTIYLLPEQLLVIKKYE